MKLKTGLIRGTWNPELKCNKIGVMKNASTNYNVFKKIQYLET